jgi:hypothetical protein
MNDGIHIMGSAHLREALRVGNIALDEPDSADRFPVALAQVVINHDLLTLPVESLHGMTADISRSAEYEYHVFSLAGVKNISKIIGKRQNSKGKLPIY